jgi:uncharacterized protein
MELTTFFFDSYAFFEIIEGNPSYSSYVNNIAIITTKLNLMELYYGLLVKYGKIVAERYYTLFAKFTIEINDNVIKEACEFKSKLKDRKLSYIDCIGYIVSKQRNIKFLTGDNGFKDLENVEFVK